MADISNKLHALVDEFVSNLSSQCDSLANNISGQAGMYDAQNIVAEAAKTPRLSNRTTTEVLNGLRRPSDNPLSDTQHSQGKTSMDRVPPTQSEEKPIHKDAVRYERPARNILSRSQSQDESDTQADVKSEDTDYKYTPPQDSGKQHRSRNDMATIGKFMGAIEILSSDQSSDDCRLANLKQSKGRMRKQSTTKTSKLHSRGMPTASRTPSPSMSRESSHYLSYSYEEDTPSHGERSQAISSQFTKLRWPLDQGDELEGGMQKKGEENNTPGNKDSHKRSDGGQLEEINFPEGDESNEDYFEGNPPET